LYRKYKPGSIFTGSEFLPAGMVLITTENGVVEAIVPEDLAGDGIMEMAGILSPGFINAHCHLELSHLKGTIEQGTGLVDFVQQVMGKRAGAALVAEEYQAFKEQAMKSAVEELLRTGTVAVGDICNNTDSLLVKQNSPLYWHDFIEVSGFVDAGAASRLQAAEEILSQFSNQSSPGKQSLAPHAPYSVSKKLFELLNQKTSHHLISIHNQEAAAENELYQQKSGAFLALYKNLGILIDQFLPSGKSSMQTWVPYFTNDQSIIAVHNTFTTPQDVAAAGKNITYCICINANLYIEKTLPPLPMLMNHNCAIVLGTDSYASNWDLNIMEEITTIRQHFPGIPLKTILQWATLNGASALRIQDRYGSLEKGKQPGLVLIDSTAGTAQRLD
jgi:aminodeoxyfutalosine deaminase